MATTSTEFEGPRASILEVEIERILPGGVGLAHAQGRTLFVSLAAPGDKLRVQLDRISGRVGFASIKEIIKPSPVRVEPPCPYFGRCGGCDFQQMNYQAQLDAKIEIIRDCLQRIGGMKGGMKGADEIVIHASPKPWHYRARAKWQFDPAKGSLGYFERASHRVCDVEYCAVLVPELQQALEGLREKIRDNSFPSHHTEIEGIAGDRGVSLFPEPDASKSDELSWRIGDESYRLSAQAFFQINIELLEQLIAHVTGNRSGRMAVDLYCGVGLFTLPLARKFDQVIGIESNATAARLAWRNLENAELSNGLIVSSRVTEGLVAHRASLDSVDFLLLDPPRSGVEPGVIDEIQRIGPRQICYVSCDPATLARDLKKLCDGGYSLDSIAAFDMFPPTHHVETVVHLARSSV